MKVFPDIVLSLCLGVLIFTSLLSLMEECFRLVGGNFSTWEQNLVKCLLEIKALKSPRFNKR